VVIASKVVVSSLRVTEDEISPETVVASVVVTESPVADVVSNAVVVVSSTAWVVVVPWAKVSDDETTSEIVVVCVAMTESSAVVDRGSVVSGLLDTELSMVVDSIAVSVLVVETDDGRHGPALTLWMAKTANAPERKDDEIMFKSE